MSGESIQLGISGFDELVEVARGGFGIVYRARQPEFDRTVAIKVVHGSLDQQAKTRFDRERRAIGSLSGHPNIVTVYASGLTSDGRPYIAMEYLPGGSLADRLGEGPLPWREAFEHGAKLAGALQVAHDAGVLHRDIKPDNIIVSAFGEPKLGDFGIARIRGGPETRSGPVTATIAHAAPEVLDGERPSAAADVYSLGSTLYALIAGQPAFVREEDESVLALMHRVMSEPLPDLRPRGVPDAACEALERAMAKSPTERIATAGEFGRRLGEALGVPDESVTRQSDTMHVPEPPAPEPVEPQAAPTLVPGAPRPPRPRRARALVALATTLVLVMVVAGAALLLGGDGDGNGGAGGGSGGATALGSVETVRIPGADHLAVGAGGVWVTTPDSIERIDPDTRDVSTVTEVADRPHAIAERDGTLWVTATDVPSLMRVDPGEPEADTGVTRLDLSSAPIEVAVGDSGVWVTRAAALDHVDPENVELIATTDLAGASPDAVALDEGRVWVANRIASGPGQVVQVDPDTGKLGAITQVGERPDHLAVGEDAVWVANAGSSTVSRIDPASDAVVATITIPLSVTTGGTSPPEAVGVAVGNGAVWVAAGNRVWQIDTETNEITDDVEVGAGAESIAVGAGAVWVVNVDDGTVSRIDLR